MEPYITTVANAMKMALELETTGIHKLWLHPDSKDESIQINLTEILALINFCKPVFNTNKVSEVITVDFTGNDFSMKKCFGSTLESYEKEISDLLPMNYKGHKFNALVIYQNLYTHTETKVEQEVVATNPLPLLGPKVNFIIQNGKVEFNRGGEKVSTAEVHALLEDFKSLF